MQSLCLTGMFLNDQHTFGWSLNVYMLKPLKTSKNEK